MCVCIRMRKVHTIIELGEIFLYRLNTLVMSFSTHVANVQTFVCFFPAVHFRVGFRLKKFKSIAISHTPQHN